MLSQGHQKRGRPRMFKSTPRMFPETQSKNLENQHANCEKMHSGLNALIYYNINRFLTISLVAVYGYS
jgi:hypothetical protein